MAFQALIGTLDVTALEASGVQWSTAEMEGMGASGSTLQVVQKPRQSGGWAGDAFSTPAHYVLSGLVAATSQDLLTNARDRLIAAASLSGTVLQVTEASKVWTSVVRREDEVIFTYITDVVASWSVQFVAVDPRKFGLPLTGSTFLPSASGGLTVPFTVPFAINSTVVSGQVSLTNPGNAPGRVVIRLDGPLVGPQVTHSGSALPLTFASSLVLGAGEWLTVDMDRRTALANDQASRNSTITSRGWSSFDPGPNTWSFTATGYNALSKMTVTAYPASL